MGKKEFPENIRQAIDLIVAVLRRMKAKRLDLTSDPRFVNIQAKGAATI